MFTTPLGLLGLLAVPAVLALHLFRRRFRPRPAAGLFLWSDGDRTELSGRKRERLIRSPSLWIECAAAALLGLALAGPSGCSGTGAPGFAFVIDNSASMRAGAGERAVDELAKRLGKLPQAARICLVAAGTRPRALTGSDASPAEARSVLDDLEFSASEADLTAAFDLAQRMVASKAPITVYTDGLEAAGTLELASLVALGEAQSNLALHGGSRRTQKNGTETVTALLANLAETPTVAGVRLDALEDSRTAELARDRVELDAGETRMIRFEIPSNPLAVRLSIEASEAAGNALDLDDELWIAPPLRHPLLVHLQLADRLRGQLGLEGDAWLAALAPAELTAHSGEAHLILRDPSQPSLGPDAAGAPRLILEWNVPAEEASASWLGPFLIDRSSPALEGVSFQDALWTGPAEPIETGSKGRPLVSAGSRPLLVEHERSGSRRFAIHADPARSSWVRSADWPVLLANLAALARAEQPGPARTNLSVGTPLVWRSLGAESAELFATGPFENVLAERRIRISQTRGESHLEFPTPGLWHVEDASGIRIPIGASLDHPSESDLRSRTSGASQSANSGQAFAGSATRASSASRLRTLLAIAAGALCLIDLLFTRSPKPGVAP